MNRFVNFDKSEIIRCSCIDCDDWDVVKVNLCEFCEPENVKKREKTRKTKNYKSRIENLKQK